MLDVAVVGHLGRDLALAIPHLITSGKMAVSERLEQLGGAVNQAVACRQLGLSAAIVGVVGSDSAGEWVLARTCDDEVDVRAVVVRPGGTTALFVDVVEADGTRALLEDVPCEVRLTTDDVRASETLLRSARAVLAQAAQPAAAVHEALSTAREAGALSLLDGAPPNGADELVRLADVVRADAPEAASLLGRPLEDAEATRAAARDLLNRGPRLVALATADQANVLAWRDTTGATHDVVLPLLGSSPVDPTGGGDAFVAGLVTALLNGQDEETAGWWASAAAARTVGHLSGRPRLDLEGLREDATAGRDAYRWLT